MTEERKQELLEKFEAGTLTDEEVEEIGGEAALLNLWAPPIETPRPSRHVFKAGKFSKWVD